jgi:lysophospholipase L1-like esterase
MSARRPLARLCVVLFAVALPLALTAPASHRIEAQQHATVLALGDSVPAGLSASLPRTRGFPALLQNLIQAEALTSDDPSAIQLVNLAEPGETVRSFVDDGQLDEALDWIERARDGEVDLRVVTLMLGGNDLLDLWDQPAVDRGARLDAFAADFSEAVDPLADELDGLDVDVVVMTYYDLTGGDETLEGSDAWWLVQFNDVIRQEAEDAGWQVVDLEPVFRDRILDLTWHPADVHPNNAGHREIARAIWSQIGYDDAPPELSIDRPAAGDVVSRTPTIRASVTDNVGVETVLVIVDGDVIEELIFVRAEAVYVGVVDLRDRPEMTVPIEIVARDLAGNESRESVVLTLLPR